MLETIREYGLERLDATGDADTVRRAHADYFLTLAESAEPQLTGQDCRISWLQTFDWKPNMTTFVRHSDGSSKAKIMKFGCGYLGALWRIWGVRAPAGGGPRVDGAGPCPGRCTRRLRSLSGKCSQ